ncbi:rCG23986, isoform CRA_e [Rattus norvegicus]|uniref:RCG23986, isoform CRA_e n=1 Tax=Rattus norvegicus TaxID=10116 RepID=A6JWI8_RAT|nr:rCG23986, isoform CRA_e [Rattus norvegicus]
MITGDQTSLQSVFCPTSDFTCGVTMFIILSKEKKNLVKKTKTTTKKTILF